MAKWYGKSFDMLQHYERMMLNEEFRKNLN
jgi:hypothetical protein